MVMIGYGRIVQGRRTYLVSFTGQKVDSFSSYGEAVEFAASLCDGLGYTGMYVGTRS